MQRAAAFGSLDLRCSDSIRYLKAVVHMLETTHDLTS
jgi:hypothetical protein